MTWYYYNLRKVVKLFSLFLIISASCLALPSYAIVDANSVTNTNAPPDGAPWANVGQVNGPSGVYLGAGWVLTAAHVGAGNINLNGELFFWDGAAYRLTNSDGSFTCSLVFHFKTTPDLHRLTLASKT